MNIHQKSIELSSIQVGSLLGDGGEGEVFEIQSNGSDVLKLFKSSVRTELSENGLNATIDLLAAMSPSDRDLVTKKTVWPHTLVRESGRFVGFIMPALTKEFFCVHGQKGNSMEGMNDWNKLTFRRAWMSNGNLESNCPPLWYPDGESLEDLDDGQNESRLILLNLLEDLALLFEIFHRYRIVVGDVSGRNILWSRITGSSVMLIDCDGCRQENTVGVTRAKQSPDWFDPEISASDSTNIESDLYKLAIALYRGYFADGLGMPERNKVPLISDSEKEFQQMALRGVSSSGRPTAREWVSFIRQIKQTAQFAGRPMISDWRTDSTAVDVAQTPRFIEPDKQRPDIQIR